MRGNISDLRHDMNSLRKQMEDKSNIISATSNLQAVGNTTIAFQPSTEDAIAEEIKEPPSLNLSDLGRQMVEKALERNGGNRKKAAQELGISDRTLYRKLKQYGLDNK